MAHHDKPVTPALEENKGARVMDEDNEISGLMTIAAAALVGIGFIFGASVMAIIWWLA